MHRLNSVAGEIIAAYTFDAGPNAVIYYDEQHEAKVLGLLFKNFGKVNGWDKKVDIESLDQDFVADAVDYQVHKNVSRIILTRIGEGPQPSTESLINSQGLPI